MRLSDWIFDRLPATGGNVNFTRLELETRIVAEQKPIMDAASKLLNYIDRNWPGKRSERLPVQELRAALAQWEGGAQ